LLGTRAINYTMVGDSATFVQGLALAGDWLNQKRVDACLVISAEEVDWITSDAYRRFQRNVVLSDGAGAVFLTRGFATANDVTLQAVTDSHLFLATQSPTCAAKKMAAQLPGNPADTLLCDSRQNLPRFDAPENAAWTDWNGPRVSVKAFLGEGLTASSAWQCLAAIDALRQLKYQRANVSVVGCNQQAIGAQFALGHGAI
jgi:hypothetical protein